MADELLGDMATMPGTTVNRTPKLLRQMPWMAE
jgi:hypothetical protein